MNEKIDLLKYEFEPNEKLYQLKYEFKKNEYSSYLYNDLFEKKFSSYLMYEWSKRKETCESFNMWVSCLVIENKYVYRYDDVFLFDQNETELIKKIRMFLKIFYRLYFPDVKIYFFVEDGDDMWEDKMHLLEDLIRTKHERCLKNYDFSIFVG